MESNLELKKDKGTSLIHFVQLHVQTVTVLRTGQQMADTYLSWVWILIPPIPSDVGYIQYFGLSKLFCLPEVSILQCVFTYSDTSTIVHFVKSVLKQQQLKTDHSVLESLSLQSFCIKQPVSGFLISVSQGILVFLKLVLKTQFLHLPSQDPLSPQDTLARVTKMDELLECR